MPGFNFSEKTPKNFWKEVSKDIFSSFTPTNKTLLSHLMNHNKSIYKSNHLNKNPQIQILDNIKSKTKNFVSLHEKSNVRSKFIAKKRAKSATHPKNCNLENVYKNSNFIRRKSCFGSIFGLETPLQKKTNFIPYKIKYIPTEETTSIAVTNKKSIFKRSSLSIVAIVRTSANHFNFHFTIS